MRRLAYRRGGHWRNGVAKSPATTRNRSVQRPFCIGVPTDIDVAHSSDIRIRSCRNTPQQTPASRRGGRRGPSDSARQHTDLQVPPERHDPYLRRGEGIPVLSCHPGPPRRQNSPLGIRTVIAHAAEIVLVPPERHDPYLRRGEGIPVLSCHPGPPRRQNSPLGIRTVIAHAAEIVLV